MRRWPLVVTLLAACTAERAPASVDVRAFGARGDGIADETSAIQAAIDSVASGGTILIPDGSYRINVGGPEGGLRLYSHQILELSAHATLAVIPGDSDYELIQIHARTDVTIRGGILLGDRTRHVLLETEDGHGHGVVVLSSDAVVLDHVQVRDFWGDGFYIGPIDEASPPSHDVRISDCVADANRRQGLSITHAYNVVVENSVFMNTHGTAPEAGIDLEPSYDAEFVRDVQIVNNMFLNNTYGVLIVGFVGATENVTVSTNTMRGNEEAGIALTGSPSMVLLHRNVIQSNGNGISLDDAADNRIEDNLIERNFHHGLALTGASHNAISGNLVFGNGDLTVAYDNLRLDDASSFNIIARNRFRRGDSPSVSGYGIHITTPDCVGDTILDNDLSCAGVLGDISDRGSQTVIREPASTPARTSCVGSDQMRE